MFTSQDAMPPRKSRTRGKRTQTVISSEQLVCERHLSDQQHLPYVIEPAYPEVNLKEWSLNHLDWIEQKLEDKGALLFRGFQLRGDADFLDYIDGLPYETITYNESTTPRTSVKQNIYTSTEFPPEESIAMHHELSAGLVFPKKVWFYCVTAPPQGGQTPIGDGYRIYERMDPGVRAKFLKKGWSLIRHYGDGVGLDWRQAFHTEQRSVVQDYCEANAIDYRWLEGDRLWTRQTRPVVLLHPRTNRPVWFNHMAFWHPANLCDQVREEMTRAFGENGLPYQSFYGDGTPIPDAVARHVADCYRQEKCLFDWQAGDLLMVDNARVTHGREPFRGDRRILVAMAEAHTREDLPMHTHKAQSHV